MSSKQNVQHEAGNEVHIGPCFPEPDPLLRIHRNAAWKILTKPVPKSCFGHAVGGGGGGGGGGGWGSEGGLLVQHFARVYGALHLFDIRDKFPQKHP